MISLVRRATTALVGVALTFAMAPAASAAPAALPSSLTQCSDTLYHGDRRLGPEHLPVLGKVGFELIGYRRTGLLSEQEFLDTYYDSAAGSYRYPPSDGYLLRPDGQPIKFDIGLAPGLDIDRFGSEFGSFLAPAGSPYASRAIPPQSLVGTPAAGCNYHEYQVLRPFTVHSGPIAPWFAQPGLGLQYQLDAALVPGAPTPINVMWLVNNGYLKRLV